MAFFVKNSETFRIENSGQIRELAQKLQAMGATECERKEKASRKATIKAKILGGETTPFRWTFGVVRGTGVHRRVDGQHSSEVVLELTVEEWAQVKFPLFVIWTEYDCETGLDVATLFEQFDPQGSVRDRDDLVGVHLGIHKDLKVSPDIANRMLDGLIWYEYRVNERKIDKDRRYHMIHESQVNRDFLSWGGGFFDHNYRELHSDAVMAAIFHTTSIRPDAAPGFWKEVAGGKSQLDPDTIAYKLAEYLAALIDTNYEWSKSVTHRSKGKVLKKPTPFDTFSTCLRAFQATLIGRKIVEIFAPDNDKDAKDIVRKYPLVSKTVSTSERLAQLTSQASRAPFQS